MARNAITRVSAADINEAHRQAKASAETAIGYAIRCGELLARKKAELPHGEFQDWVEKHCEFSARHARRYMDVAAKTDTRVRFDSLRDALGYESKPKSQQGKSDAKEGAVPVVKAPADALEAAGETAVEPPAAPGSEPAGDWVADINAATPPPAPKVLTVEPPPAFDFDGYEPEDDEDYKARIEAVMASDDQLGAMREQLEAAHREIAAMKASRDHYQMQAGEAVRLVKARDRQIGRLERDLAKERAEVERLKERVAIMEDAA